MHGATAVADATVNVTGASRRLKSDDTPGTGHSISANSSSRGMGSSSSSGLSRRRSPQRSPVDA